MRVSAIVVGTLGFMAVAAAAKMAAVPVIAISAAVQQGDSTARTPAPHIVAMPPKKSLTGMSAEEKEAYLKARAEAKRQRTGGMVFNYATMKGEVAFLNTQKRVPSEPLATRVRTMADYFCSNFKLKEWKNPVSLANAEETRVKSGANAAVFIVDDPSIPVTILTAPETRWCFLNVAALAADNPDDKKLLARTRRELWRTLGFMLGNDSVADVCVMKAVNSLKELDELGAEAPSSGPLILVSRRLRAIGVEPFTRATYSRALREGWAPMPTNELQRAVYDRWMEQKSGKREEGK